MAKLSTTQIYGDLEITGYSRSNELEVGQEGEGIKFSFSGGKGDRSSRIFFREASSELYGGGIHYNGSGNALNIFIRNNSGSDYNAISIARATGIVTLKDSMNILSGNVEIGTYNSTATGSLLLNGSTANKQAVLKCTSGNLHIDANSGHNTYLNYYNGETIYFGAGGNAGNITKDGKLTVVTFNGKTDMIDVASSSWPYKFTTQVVSANDNWSGFWVASNGYPDMRLRKDNQTVTARISSHEQSYVTNGFKSHKITLERQNNAASGYNFYNQTINAWQQYMASGGQTSAGYNGNLTATQGTYVTSWAMRSNVEPLDNYGWIWETIANGATGATSVVAELASKTGHFKTKGNIYGAKLYTTGASGYFFNDNSTRTAFTGGDFYIQSGVNTYYNYANNQYHGGSSGDNLIFRGNHLYGNNWDLSTTGVLTLTTDSTALKLYRSANGSGAGIEFSDQNPTPSQKGYLKFYHSDSDNSVGCGSVFKFSSTESHHGVILDSAGSNSNFYVGTSAVYHEGLLLKGRHTVNIDTSNPTKFWVTDISTSTTVGTKPADYYYYVNFPKAPGGTGSQMQLASYYGTANRLYFRSKQDSDGGWRGWAQVYTSDHKPSASAIGALSSSGGTLTGGLQLSGQLNNTGTASYDQIKTSGGITVNTYFTSSDSAVVLGTSTSGTVYLRPVNKTSSTDQSTFTASKATIGTNMDVSGAIVATGDVTAYSDRRLKTNIKPLINSLDIVLQLQGVSFNRIDREQDVLNIGLIAQDVEKVLPELVKTQDDENETKSVNYQNMVAVLIEAIKEQQDQIDELKKKVDKPKFSLIKWFKSLF